MRIKYGKIIKFFFDTKVTNIQQPELTVKKLATERILRQLCKRTVPPV